MLPNSLKVKVFLLSLVFQSSLNTAFAQADVHSIYEKALQAYTTQDFDDAYIHLKNLLQQDAEHLPGKLLMGKMLLKNAYFEAATDEFMDVLALGADANLLVEPLSEAILLSGEPTRVFSIQMPKTLNRNNQATWRFTMAIAHIAKSEFDIAKQLLLQVLREFPQHVQAANSLTSLFIEQGDSKAASELNTKTLAIDANNGEAWRLKARLAQLNGDHEVEAQAIKTAQQLSPSDPLVLQSAASFYWSKGDLSNAEQAVDNLLALAPQNPSAMLLKSQILASRGHAKESQVLLQTITAELSLMEATAFDKQASFIKLRGIAAYLQGNFQQAVNDLRKVIQQQTPAAELLVLQADALSKLGRDNDALQLLETHDPLIINNPALAQLFCHLSIESNKAFKCLNLLPEFKQHYPDNQRILLTEAKLAVSRNRYDEALEVLEGITAPDILAQKRAAQITLLLQLGRVQKATPLMAELLSMSTNDADVFNLAAAHALKSQQWQQALDYAIRALALAPESASAQFNLASALQRLKRPEEALEALNEIKDRIAGPELNLLLSELLLTQGHTQQAVATLQEGHSAFPQHKQLALTLTDRLLMNQHLEEALQHAQRVSRRDPFDNELRFKLAEVLVASNELAEAMQTLVALDESWRRIPKNGFKTANLYRRAGNLQQAEKVLSALDDGTNPQAAIERLRLQIAMGDFQAATQQLQKVKSKQGTSANLLFAEAELLLASQQEASGLAALEALLIRYPQYLPALHLWHQTAQRNGDNDALIAYLEQRMDQQPATIEQHILADLLLLEGNLDQAIGHYRDIAQQASYPKRASALNNLANLQAKNNLTEALQTINQAIKLEPQQPQFIDSKGWILAQLQRWDESLEQLRKATAMQGSDPNIQYHLSYVLAKLGRKQEAFNTLSETLSSDRPFSERAAAEQLLKELQTQS